MYILNQLCNFDVLQDLENKKDIYTIYFMTKDRLGAIKYYSRWDKHTHRSTGTRTSQLLD